MRALHTKIVLFGALFASLFCRVQGSSDTDLRQPLSALAEQFGGARVYRVELPLTDARKTLVVVFTHPSYDQVKQADVSDSVEYAIGRSRLNVGIFSDTLLLRQQSIPVSEQLFRQLLNAFRRSEALNLPSMMVKTEYVSEAVLDSGLVTLESFSGELRLVRRYKGQSVAVDYVADEVLRIVAAKIDLEK